MTNDTQATIPPSTTAAIGPKTVITIMLSIPGPKPSVGGFIEYAMISNKTAVTERMTYVATAAKHPEEHSKITTSKHC